MSNAIKQKELFGHPVGLYILFLTEMWERFSYYGMRAILVLYLTSETLSDNPGLGWTDGRALALYGWYTMLVYVASIPGGIIADKIIGQKRSVLYGGLLLCAGHGVLSIEQNWAFYTGLALIVAGVGLLKPNISTLVGGLYEPGDDRRDKGFSIFYIGINVGA
ncbi:MAG: POT family proton-dependent oligopeptide transporter, partial [Nonlabens sp.]